MTHAQDRLNTQKHETKLSKKQRTAAHWRTEMGRGFAVLVGDVQRFFNEYRRTKKLVGILYWASIVQVLWLVGLTIYVVTR